MRVKNIDNHSKRGFIIHQTKLIDELLKDGKIKQADMMINDLIKSYPNDNVLLFLKVRIFAIYGQYKEAYDLLQRIEGKEEYYPFYLALLAILNHDLEKMEFYYYEYFANRPISQKKDQNAVRIYLQKIFEPDKEINPSDYYDENYKSYNLRQYISYSPELAYNHIFHSHVLSKNPDKTKFNSNIDIKKLMVQIKKLIEDNKGKSCLVNLQELYFFAYPHCGRYNDDIGNDLNYITASTIYNTSDILTIYPGKNTHLNQQVILPIQSEEVGKELKRVSQIDKFNMRYGKNK